jgi:hypothetical protein
VPGGGADLQLLMGVSNAQLGLLFDARDIAEQRLVRLTV